MINTASFVAVMGAATSQISYTASKGGVLSLSRELGVEFARTRRPRKRALPGTGRHAAASGVLRQGPRAGGAALVHVPMGRFGKAEEIAAAAAFLASDDSSFMTASSLLIDGGISGAYTTPQ